MKTTILNFKIMNKNILIVLISALPIVASFSQSSSFKGLGDFPGGDFSSQASSVSADGLVVAGYSTTDKGSQAFIWTESSGMVSLGNVADKSFKSSYAIKISADGKTIVGEADSTGQNDWFNHQGFVWTETDGMKKFGSLNGSNHYMASAVSSDGSVIAGNGGKEAFYWTKSKGIRGLGFLSGKDSSCIQAISADGLIAVGLSSKASGDAMEAVRWTEKDGMVGLGFLPGHKASFCNGISPDGSVILVTSYLSDNNAYACRWTIANGMENLGRLPGKSTMHPSGASTNGKIIVGSGWDTQYIGQAFIWDSVHGIRDLKTVLQTEYGLNLTGWKLTDPSTITPDGKVIVGQGTNPSGKQEAFRAVLGNPVTSVKTISDKLEFYPNPAKNTIHIKYPGLSSQNIDYTIFDLTGKAMLQGKLTNNTVDISALSEGVHILKMNINGAPIIKKLVIE
jgi:probable HAF family extracellular repeat protein